MEKEDVVKTSELEMARLVELEEAGELEETEETTEETKVSPTITERCASLQTSNMGSTDAPNEVQFVS